MKLIRHAQSTWNEAFSRTRIDPNLPDAKLTNLGFRQAAEAAKELERRGPIELIVCSPYRRALQTAAIVNTRFHAPVRVEPCVRERKAFSCDIGSSPMSLSLTWPDWDFSALDQKWWGEDEEEESAASVDARCSAFRELASGFERPETVLVVSHWGFLLALTGESVENGQIVEWSP